MHLISDRNEKIGSIDGQIWEKASDFSLGQISNSYEVFFPFHDMGHSPFPGFIRTYFSLPTKFLAFAVAKTQVVFSFPHIFICGTL